MPDKDLVQSVQDSVDSAANKAWEDHLEVRNALCDGPFDASEYRSVCGYLKQIVYELDTPPTE